MSVTRFKICSRCSLLKPATLTYFIRRVRAKDGLTAYCKRCAVIEQRRRNARKAKKPRTSKYTKPSDRQRAYYWRNREKALAYYQANKETIKAQSRAWQKANRERARLHQAKRRKALGTLQIAVIRQMYDDQDGVCAYCEIPLDGCYHVDHMLPVSRGGSTHWDNLAITCPLCNARKSARTTLEFLTN